MENQTSPPTVHIIGWGLAGVTLAWQLYFRKIPFKVFDSGTNVSTRVAAGLVNPIVFKRLTKSWNVDALFPAAENFYQQVETELNLPLLSRKNIYYPFSGIEDENNWSVKMGDERFSPYLNHTPLRNLGTVETPHGCGKVSTFGNLDTNTYLDKSAEFFQNKGIEIIQEKVSADQNLTHGDAWFVFCEGVNIIENKLFQYLPLKPAHGETLTVDCPDLNFDEIISKNLFILPLGSNYYKIGATYNWELKEPVVTESGKEDLIARFENLVKSPYTILEHKAGIRPTVHDRKPLLGIHPVQKNAAVFNGLGTKGVLLAPYYADHLLNHLLLHSPLDSEVDIHRFSALHEKS